VRHNRAALHYGAPVKITDEHEVKLEAPAGFVLPDLGGTPLERRVFTSTYYDTAEGSLAAVGITLRRRVENGAALWQLKLPVEGSRLELEQPGGPVGPPDELASLLLAHTRRGPLEPVAELRTRRSGVLVDDGAARAEVVLDEVDIMEARRVADRFVELEVELQDGDPKRLAKIAKQLRRSGAQNGNGTPKVFRALKRPEDDRPGGLRGWVAEQTRQILRNDPGTRLGTDPEAVHDFRVAVRRLRATLRAVEPRPDYLRSELKWLGGVLGAVRDLDVMLEHVNSEIARLGEPEQAAAASITTALERKRRGARKTMLGALGTPRYFALLDELAAYEAPNPSAKQLRRDAEKELGKLAKAVDAAGADPPDATLHHLRIRGKKARYAAELAEAEPAFVKRAKQFQDVLGEHQDAVVMEERLRGLVAEGEAPARALAIGRLIERERARLDRTRGEWRDAWRELERSARTVWA
jgi:CHAD domain-containing protein